MKNLLVLLLLCIAGIINGQEPVYKNFTTSDGLPSTETYTCIQDSKGYMWFGTDRGIVRYDGYNFKVYTTAEGLPDNTVFEFFKDAAGRVWFKTFSSEMGYIEGDSVYTYKYNQKLRAFLPNHIVGAVLFYKNNLVFVKSVLTPRTFFHIYEIDTSGHVDSLPAGQHPKYIFIGRNGSIVNQGKNIPGTSRVFWYDTREQVGEFTVTEPVINNFLALLKKSAGFYLYSDKQVFLYKDNVFKKILDCNDDVLCIQADENDNLWLGFRNNGLACYAINKGYQKKFSLLRNYSVSSIYNDRENGIWITTLENGIFYVSPQTVISYTENSGLPATGVKRIEKAGENILMVLSDNTVMLKKDGETAFTSLFRKKNAYMDFACGNDGTIYSTFPELQNLPLKNKVVGLDVAKKIVIGKRYVYTAEPRVVTVYEKNGRVVAQYDFNTPRKLSVCETNKGFLLGTLQGAFLYEEDSLVSLAGYHPLFKNRISEIKRYDKDHIIFCTIGNGLFIIKNNNYSEPIHYTTVSGLPSPMCNTVLRANDSVTWVGTNRGLCCIRNILDPQRAEFLTIDIDNGIASNEINDICLADTVLWLATTRGATLIPALGLQTKVPDIPVYIEGITVDGEKPNKLVASVFSYRKNSISIFFTGLHFQHAGKLLYKYRLRGDDKWFYTNSRSVVYNSLQPGRYTFEVGVVKPDGSDNPLLDTYSFTILPPFWKTWWFTVLIITAACLAVYLFISYRVRFVRNRELLRADLDRFRDKALRDQMNPHFIYNSLNSIQNFILKNDALESASFLSKFSRLMRLVFNHTAQDTVTLEKDLEALVLYTELENLRFPNKFTLHINHTLEKEVSRILIPPLIFQPFVENAILHGLLTKKSPGNIWLNITRNDRRLEVSITDDGIGRAAAAEVKHRKASYFAVKETPGKRKTSGIIATMERIEQAWAKKGGKSNFKIIDLHELNNSSTGTTIQFCLPIDYD